ncbi:MAG: single-stranded-DNA-specific exonuclease RecJ [Cryobacterium sp.]|nr:single-stranded-DNA-specific exonuclease RecJ [Oligoflexia bacterium]
MGELSALTGLAPLTVRLCLSRGLTTAELIQEYVSPKLEHLKHPSTIKDMDLAVTRLADAKEKGEKIRVFGDYDVDGTTGAALLSWFFRDCEMDFTATQPDRFKDGYGLNIKAVSDAKEAGASVLVTVDCGITSFDAAERARELGIDLIIIDHHQIDLVRGVPQAFAVVNPQRADDSSGLKELCGCGVAFYLIRALRSEGRKRSWWPAGKEPNLKQHLDLVVLATAADMVPLIGDNHILVKQGLEVLKATTKPGVAALLETSGVAHRDFGPSHLGFAIGPRINASGRMSNASHALELLTTKDVRRAGTLAADLERMNVERQDLQNAIWDEVRLRVEEGIAAGKYQHAILVGDANWHEGVVGIVASKVTETFRKPAAVLALREDFGKGSVRSWGSKDVLEALRRCAPHLKSFGGHKYAAGLSVELENFDTLVTAFDEAVGSLEVATGMDKPLLTEGDATVEELDFKTLQEIEKLGPFGPGNPEPIFVVRAKPVTHSVMKGRHLKLSLAPVRAEGDLRNFARGAPSLIEAVWFNAAERDATFSDALKGPSLWAAIPEINRFRGKSTPTLRVKDRRDLPSPDSAESLPGEVTF